MLFLEILNQAPNSYMTTPRIIFCNQAYTYGLCGPLKLSPSEAVVTDQSYNGGFMAGRIASIFVSKVTYDDINKVTRRVGYL